MTIREFDLNPLGVPNVVPFFVATRQLVLNLTVIPTHHSRSGHFAAFRRNLTTRTS